MEVTQDIESVNEALSESIEKLMDTLQVQDVCFTPSEIRGTCPVHLGDNKTSFVFWPDIGRWRCFTQDCQNEYGGTAIGLIRGVKKCSFPKAMDFVRSFLGQNNISVEQIPTEKKIVAQMESVDEWEAHLAQRTFPESLLEKLSSAETYANKRGINLECFSSRGVGFAKAGKLKNRIVFPVRNFTSNIVGFTGRKAYDNGPYPKWFHYEFETSINLFNIERAKEHIKESGLVIICEGPIDVLKFEMAGFYNVVAIFGTKIHSQQMTILNKCGTLDIALALDNDYAGNKAEAKNSQIVERFLSGLCIIKALPDSDFGEMTVEEIQLAVKMAGIDME